jgi:hypothetical protein
MEKYLQKSSVRKMNGWEMGGGHDEVLILGDGNVALSAALETFWEGEMEGRRG